MLDRIRILAQVVESGSFSRAARALNQAPSSVTRAIDALEPVSYTHLTLPTKRIV